MWPQKGADSTLWTFRGLARLDFIMLEGVSVILPAKNVVSSPPGSNAEVTRLIES